MSPKGVPTIGGPRSFEERDSPAAVYALAMYQRGWTRMSPEKAASEVARIRALPEYQSGNKLFTDQVALLSKVAARGQSRELPMPAKVAPAARSAVQAEIDKIRSDPKYTSPRPTRVSASRLLRG
jgi:hypothetical protein